MAFDARLDMRFGPRIKKGLVASINAQRAAESTSTKFLAACSLSFGCRSGCQRVACEAIVRVHRDQIRCAYHSFVRRRDLAFISRCRNAQDLMIVALHLADGPAMRVVGHWYGGGFECGTAPGCVIIYWEQNGNGFPPIPCQKQ